MKYAFVDKTLFKMLKKVIGIENGILFPCAGAYLSDEVNTFLHSVGINICMGYGLSETTATVSCFSAYNKDYTIGTVGTPMPDVQVKIGKNNEILVKGKTVTKGYYKKEVETKEAFDEEGWFHTGDAGAIDEKGNLIITERIKDLYKTSNGKYIAPQQIESKLGADKFIERLPKVYDTPLGRMFDGGEELSMGQWQRVALARQLYSDAPVLVFDEPTAWMDVPSRDRFYETLDMLQKQNKVIILIKHV